MGENKSPLVPSPDALDGKKPPAGGKTAVVPVALIYNVYLFNAVGIKKDSTLSAADQAAIASTIQGFFDQIIAARKSMAGTKFSRASVQWIPTAGPYPTIAPYELLVYLLPNGKTIVMNRQIESIPPPSELGRTSLGADGKNGSEAYQTNALLTADIMFHEMMHNKQNMGDSMHSQGGLAAESITAGDALTSGNIQNMAAALPKTGHPQWTDGLAILAKQVAYVTQNPNDPLGDL
jgi:hypothetical protein